MKEGVAHTQSRWAVIYVAARAHLQQRTICGRVLLFIGSDNLTFSVHHGVCVFVFTFNAIYPPKAIIVSNDV